MLRRHCAKLAKCMDCNLVVCDEAHKLKNIQGNQTIDALNALPARLRILLSGTPVQNDLQEFYALLDLVSPGTSSPSPHEACPKRLVSLL